MKGRAGQQKKAPASFSVACSSGNDIVVETSGEPCSVAVVS